MLGIVSRNGLVGGMMRASISYRGFGRGQAMVGDDPNQERRDGSGVGVIPKA